MIVTTFLIDDTDDDFGDYFHYDDDDESLARFLLIIPHSCWRRQLIKGWLAGAVAILQDAD